MHRLLIAVASLVASMGSKAHRLQWLRHMGSVVVVPRLQSTGSVVVDAAAAAKSIQSCPTLCNPRDGSPSGSPVPGILQARILEWIAISSSNASK